jgi:regulator of protease activity HflC (stomatin/prohibitin superfamily)
VIKIVGTYLFYSFLLKEKIMFSFFFAIVFVIVGILASKIKFEGKPVNGLPKFVIRAVCFLITFFLIAGTSYVYIGKNEVGLLHKIYGGKNLKDGRIIAINGEKGPQAEILPPGFHVSLLLNVIYDVKKESVVIISENHYGYLVAKDGRPLLAGQTFADSFSENNAYKMITDTAFFLSNGGQKGPQTYVITPGVYRLNKFLWDIHQEEVTEIDKGFVGVVKSNVNSSINLGNLKADKPNDSVTGVTIVSSDKLAVPLVDVGYRGIWNKALNPGKYYINKAAYSVTLIDTRVQTWVYQGGYKKRYIHLTVGPDGSIEQTKSEEEIQKPEGAADTAIFTKTEGWDVPIELRVLVQVAPENAPFVVASVGGITEVEDRILTPSIRSIVRNVCGGTIHFQEITTDDKGDSIIDDNTGQPLTHTRMRQAKVLDLIENRDLLERNVEDAIKPEGLKAGVDIKEVRFGDPIIPPELLVARQREQLAEQLARAFIQERLAQDERIKTEQAKATADKQASLVEAEIDVRRSNEFAKASENRGRGAKLELMLTSEGQKAQSEVLGADKVVGLRKFEILVGRIMTLLEANPEILTTALSNAQKFVPDRVITVNGGADSGNNGGVLNGLIPSFAIFGDALSDKTDKK